jgi:putative hydrolase of the HAD superfamily
MGKMLAIGVFPSGSQSGCEKNYNTPVALMLAKGRLNMITTVIFDMDDTLYDEVDYCRSGFRAVAEFLAGVENLTASHTADEVFDALWGQFAGGNRRATFNTALDQLGIEYDKGTIEHLVRVYREHTPTIELPPQSRKVLDMLKSEYRLALLTDGFLPGQRLKVEALGIEGDFESIVYTEELGREFWKPSVKGFKQILKELREKAGDCVYVADNAEKDFIGPNGLGMATIQIVRANRVHESPPAGPEAAPGQIIGSIEQLPQALKRLGGL